MMSSLMIARRLGWQAAGMVGAALLASCSVILDWDEEGMLCDAKKECLPDYSCLVTKCVRKHSLELGATCSDPVQCKDTNATCGSTPFTCRTECGSLYQAAAECQGGEYCRPEPDREDETLWIGTCFESMCLKDGDCASDRVCVMIIQNAGACLPSCQYDFQTGPYDDNCGSTLDADSYCQVIGLDGYQKLVCLENIGGTVQSVGEVCDPVRNPCEFGATCFDGTCHLFCSVDLDCSGLGLPCSQKRNNPSDPPLFSICDDNS